ncbi:MAG: carboxypeptidase regulatory-like domain-containing protein, partial [Opitutaceae bacterium]|nr:carboxypeptidase regulatory-like domain-containing protein [Opitutaceae bacterium]
MRLHSSSRFTLRTLAGLCCSLGFAVAFPPSAAGADSVAARSTPAAAGSITGRVQNAVIGRYLPNARIAVKGTDLVALTDEFGAYRLSAVPAGPVVLEVYYTGLDPQQVALT